MYNVDGGTHWPAGTGGRQAAQVVCYVLLVLVVPVYHNTVRVDYVALWEQDIREKWQRWPLEMAYFASGSASNKQLCYFFKQGRCNHGNSCRYIHDTKEEPQIQQQRKKSAENQVKHAAIALAKALQDAEPRPWEKQEGRFFSIDVECVAYGYGHISSGPKSQRLPGRVALVDGKGNTILDEVVYLANEEQGNVTSYLTPLTGLTQELCSNPTNPTLPEIKARIREILSPPHSAVLVGQSIEHDIEWLGLEKGVDFSDYVDIQDIFRARVAPKSGFSKFAASSLRWYSNMTAASERNNTTEERFYQELVKSAAERLQTVLSKLKESLPSELIDGDTKDRLVEECDTLPFCRYRVFSLRHTCLHLLQTDIQDSFHNPVLDARYSIILFQSHRSSPVGLLRSVRDALMRAPPTPSFQSMYHVIDGVALGRNSYRYKHAARFIWKWWIRWSAMR